LIELPQLASIKPATESHLDDMVAKATTASEGGASGGREPLSVSDSDTPLLTSAPNIPTAEPRAQKVRRAMEPARSARTRDGGEWGRQEPKSVAGPEVLDSIMAELEELVDRLPSDAYDDGAQILQMREGALVATTDMVNAMKTIALLFTPDGLMAARDKFVPEKKGVDAATTCSGTKGDRAKKAMLARGGEINAARTPMKSHATSCGKHGVRLRAETKNSNDAVSSN